MRPRAARVDITLRYLLVLIPLFVMFAVVFERWFTGELDEQLQDALEREAAHVIAFAQHESEVAPDREALASRLAAALAMADRPARLRDSAGTLARSRPGMEAAEAVLDGRMEGRKLVRRGPVKGVAQGEIVVEVAADFGDRPESVAEFRWGVAGAVAITLILAGGAGYLLVSQALRPVDEIGRAAARIDARSLDARLPLRLVDDELGRLVLTLNGMLERIETGVGAARRFTQDASHELKTPIAAIRGTVDVALLAPRRAEDDERALLAIARECERLERIVRDLLTIAQADAGALASRRERIDLRTVAGEIAEVGEILAQERGAHLASDFGATELPVDGDIARLRQVGLNLVDNAIRYGKPGGHIFLRLTRDGANGLLVVEDDGLGIAPREREKIFERFYRTRRDVAGVGLGLAIVRAIVREHQGTVLATERAGGGARFEVRVPLAG